MDNNNNRHKKHRKNIKLSQKCIKCKRNRISIIHMKRRNIIIHKKCYCNSCAKKIYYVQALICIFCHEKQCKHCGRYIKLMPPGHPMMMKEFWICVNCDNGSYPNR